jgi:hypothetical protein
VQVFAKLAGQSAPQGLCSPKLPVSLVAAVRAFCAAKGPEGQQKALTDVRRKKARRSESGEYRDHRKQSWVFCFECEAYGRMLVDLKVECKHVANAPTAPSYRSFQLFPRPSTAPQQPDGAWKRMSACANPSAASAQSRAHFTRAKSTCKEAQGSKMSFCWHAFLGKAFSEPRYDLHHGKPDWLARQKLIASSREPRFAMSDPA